MSLTTDVAWAAGLFEGEGSIVPSRRRLSLEMTDEDVVRRFVAVVGYGNVHKVQRRNRVNRDNHHTIYKWDCAKWAVTERVLLAFLPHLGLRRRTKAYEMLANPAGPIGRPAIQIGKVI